MEALCSLGAAGEKEVSSELPRRAGGASHTHSQLPFPPTGEVAARACPHLPWWRDGAGRVPLPLSVALKLFFSSHGVLESPLRKPELLQILSCLWVFALVSTLQVSPDHS